MHIDNPGQSYIAIRETVTMTDSGHVRIESATKTDDSERTITIDATTAAHLRAHRTKEAAKFRALGITSPTALQSMHVFTDVAGSLIRPDHFTRR